MPYYRRNIGMVFQDFKLLPNRTVYDNVAYALQVTGRSRKEIRAKVPDILRLTGLSTKLHNYPDQLSGGEQQRVSVARAFVNHPPLLLADEPTGNLDPETSIGIMQLLYRINRTGTTVLVATHDSHDGRPHAPPRDRARATAGSCATRPTPCTRREPSTAEFGALMRGEPAELAADARTVRRDRRGVAMRLGLLPQGVAALDPAQRRSRASRRWPRVLVTLLVLGVFIPIVQATTGAANEVRGRVLLDVYMQARRDRARHRARPPAHRDDTPHVKNVEFVSKAQAYEQERKRNPEAYELLGSNPLPDTFRVTPDKPGQHRRDPRRARPARPRRATARSIDPAIDEVKNRKDETDKILSATRVVKLTMALLASLLILASRPADLQHDPPVAVLAPARGRGDEARRRDRLVHPLAVRDRGRRRSARSAACWRSCCSRSARSR